MQPRSPRNAGAWRSLVQYRWLMCLSVRLSVSVDVCPQTLFKSLLLQFSSILTKLSTHDLCANTQTTIRNRLTKFWFYNFWWIFKNLNLEAATSSFIYVYYHSRRIEMSVDGKCHIIICRTPKWPSYMDRQAATRNGQHFFSVYVGLHNILQMTIKCGSVPTAMHLYCRYLCHGKPRWQGWCD